MTDRQQPPDWLFKGQSGDETTPMVLHVRSSHKPDDVLGDVCVECLQRWPCAFWNHLRGMALTVLNLPPQELLALCESWVDTYGAAKEEVRRAEEARGEPKRPIDFRGAKRRRE